MNRGFTLLEMVVSTAIGTFVVAAAYTLVAENGRAVARTRSDVGTEQTQRMVIDLLSHDLRQAGVGVGYQPDGAFAGLLRGDFAVRGGARFQADGASLTLQDGTISTDDLGLRFASGRVRTIAAFDGSTAEICSGSKLKASDVATIVDPLATHVRSVLVTNLAPSACSEGSCVAGCERVTLGRDAGYLSHPGANNADYGTGEIFADFAEVVWFVVPGSDGKGRLRRAVINAKSSCAARDEKCGGTVSRGVEMVQVRVLQWDRKTGAWSDVTTDAKVDGRQRIRVDVELVTRGTYESMRAQSTQGVVSEMDPSGCKGGPCATGSSAKVRRRVARTSVEIRNSGRMQIR